MTAASMPTEVVLLGWSVVLLFVHIAAQGASNAWDLDLRYLLTARDEGRKASNVYNGRLTRALANFSETYPAFVALALGLAVSGRTGGIGEVGAQLWFWSRLLYLPSYGLGIPVVRTIFWAAAMVGLVLMVVRLLT